MITIINKVQSKHESVRVVQVLRLPHKVTPMIDIKQQLIKPPFAEFGTALCCITLHSLHHPPCHYCHPPSPYYVTAVLAYLYFLPSPEFVSSLLYCIASGPPCLLSKWLFFKAELKVSCQATLWSLPTKKVPNALCP